MLTIIYTWTCPLCGNVKSHRMDYCHAGMTLAKISPPVGWSWMNDSFMVCDNHRIVVQDVEPQQEPKA